MKATISADIVRSTSLETRDLIILRKRLYELFEKFEEFYPGFWARIIRGDGIECYVPNHRDALRIALLTKLFIKRQAVEFDCSALLQKYGIRFSIGVSRTLYANREQDIIDGTAIYLSGRNLEKISNSSSIYSSFALEDCPDSLGDVLDSYVALLCNLTSSYSAKQSEVVFFKLLGYKETKLARKLGIYQSSVNMRSSSAQWNLLNTALRDFNNLNFERICG